MYVLTLHLCEKTLHNHRNEDLVVSTKFVHYRKRNYFYSVDFLQKKYIFFRVNRKCRINSLRGTSKFTLIGEEERKN